MPQAVDVAQLTRKAVTPDTRTARSARDTEPKQRFDEVLDRQSRRPDDTESTDPADRAEPAERPEQQKPAAKTAKSKKSDEHDPVEEQAPDADETTDTATAELPAVADEAAPAAPDASAEDVEASAADPDADGVDAFPTGNEALAGTAQAVIAPQDPTIAQETVAEHVVAEVDDLLPAATQSATSAKPLQATTPQAKQTALETEADTSEALGAGIAIPETASTGTETESDADADADADLAKLAFASPADSADDELPKLEPDAPDLSSVAADAKPLAATASPTTQVVKAPVAPEQRFAADNVDKIITTVKTDLTPNGGTMTIRLDPANLGELKIDVTVDDGVLHASFQTSNDEATRLLSHSMQQLKTALETAGVSVDRIQVKQAAPSEQASNQQSSEQDRNQQQHQHEHPQRQEQERREALARMWRKLALGEEPLDLVA